MAYLSGKQSASGQLYGTYCQDDVDALRALAEEPGIIDIFLTYPCLLLCFNTLLASLPPSLQILLCNVVTVFASLAIYY